MELISNLNSTSTTMCHSVLNRMFLCVNGLNVSDHKEFWIRTYWNKTPLSLSCSQSVMGLWLLALSQHLHLLVTVGQELGKVCNSFSVSVRSKNDHSSWMKEMPKTNPSGYFEPRLYRALCSPSGRRCCESGRWWSYPATQLGAISALRYSHMLLHLILQLKLVLHALL